MATSNSSWKQEHIVICNKRHNMMDKKAERNLTLCCTFFWASLNIFLPSVLADIRCILNVSFKFLLERPSLNRQKKKKTPISLSWPKSSSVLLRNLFEIFRMHLYKLSAKQKIKGNQSSQTIYTLHGILAGNPFLLSKIFLCLASFMQSNPGHDTYFRLA